MGLANIKGDIGEAAVVLEARKKGYYTGLMPQDCPYDMVIDRGNGPERVQVKYVTLRKNKFVVQIVSNPAWKKFRTYTANTVDVFAVYLSNNQTVYWIPFSDVDGLTEACFHVNCPIGHRQRDATAYLNW